MSNSGSSLNSELERLFLEFQLVSQAWNGFGESLTIDQGLRRLVPIIQQQSSPLLAKRARELTREIVLGRTYNNNHRWERAV